MAQHGTTFGVGVAAFGHQVEVSALEGLAFFDCEQLGCEEALDLFSIIRFRQFAFIWEVSMRATKRQVP